ncbi:hypothetical protein GGP41_007785 [Bipolaris sorokiniana]|uniref:Major facilitator superfamily (MFS) profile domain-containing protein n=2 Tax=Cochliobolus sativus TaxID=45130 RepID=A0A8H5ZKK9_COCSA|nr:uncharacterized protein COCSADRAFT_165624 [Bipolaris sorokiniana ND90Pr]EMD58422.1 hypothetical protein COCSADRAFT_165624 [Bipolaris sorokiniana ND90Pr]KAF5852338.1 hypothetical protein GGP41_007785 [Bipolaris sorokiniana]
MERIPTPSWLRPENDASRSKSLGWAVTGMACLAMYIDTFQATMVNFGLTAIMKSLNMTPFDVNWVSIAYSLAFATILPISGSIIDRYGLRFGFLLGTGFLTWSSALCAATPNKYGLIVGRAFCGMGAAMSTATGPPIVTHLFSDEKKRTKGLSLLIMCGPLGMVTGMILGALLVESSIGWRALFWLVLAMNGFLCIAGYFLIPIFPKPPHDPTKKFDKMGLGMIITGLPMLIYGIDDGGNRGWTSPEILVTIILGGLLVIGFPIYERRLENPVLPKPFLFDRNMVLMLLNFLVFGGGFAAWLLLITQVFLNCLHLSAFRSALYLLPAAVGSVVSGGLGNFLSQCTSVRVQIGGAYLWTAGFLIPWGLMDVEAHRAYIIVFALLYLFGNAPAVVRAQATTLCTIPEAQHGQATAMLMVAYQTGSAILLALCNAVAKSFTKDPNLESSLMNGYQSSFWLLLGITGTAGLAFVVLYQSVGNTDAGSETKSGTERSEIIEKA